MRYLVAMLSAHRKSFVLPISKSSNISVDRREYAIIAFIALY